MKFLFPPKVIYIVSSSLLTVMTHDLFPDHELHVGRFVIFFVGLCIADIIVKILHPNYNPSP